jgi:membrane dipeptidase
MCSCFSLLGAQSDTQPGAQSRARLRAPIGREGASAAVSGGPIPAAVLPTSPWIDVHAHPGRCFMRGLDENDAVRKALGGDDSVRAVADLVAGGVALASFSTVADLRVLSVGPNGITTGREFEGGEAWSDHQRQLTALLDLASEGAVRLVRAPSEIKTFSPGDAPGMLITCEGGDFLEGDASRVEEVWQDGVRSITIVHYRVNELGDIQTEQPRHGGLTPFGAEVIDEMNRLGMIIDLAHATWDVTKDVLDQSSHPVMISHSHLARDEDSHPRLLSQEHALAVAMSGGLVGAWPAGVALETFDDYLEEILRMIDLLGVEHVSIGTDMDANYQPVMTSYREMPLLAAGLRGRGLSEAETALVMGENFIRLFEAVASRSV